jgi:hypothetical protein
MAAFPSNDNFLDVGKRARCPPQSQTTGGGGNFAVSSLPDANMYKQTALSRSFPWLDDGRFNRYGGSHPRRSDAPGGGVDLVANLVAAGFNKHHPPKVWCFVRSYHADARWLSFALRSLHRFARHVVQRVVVAVPGAEAALFESFLKGFEPWVELSLVTQPLTGDAGDFTDGYDQVKYDVLTADERVRGDVDFILHMDSDAAFVRHLLWTDLFAGGKAVARMTKWENLPPHFKQTQYADVKEAIGGLPDGEDVEHDFARHVGLVYPRRAYQLARDRVELTHGQSFRSFVAGSTVSVTDYNVLGAVMYHFHRGDMKWVEVDEEDGTDSRGRFPVLRHSSWSGLTVEEATRLECMLTADVSWSQPGGDGAGDPRWTPEPFENCPAFNLCSLGQYRVGRRIIWLHGPYRLFSIGGLAPYAVLGLSLHSRVSDWLRGP